MNHKNEYLTSFTPKLISTLRDGYTFSMLRKDAIAGLTVAIVAIPLAMAIAIASGTTPEKGLITAIIAGFLISMLGGSRHQIGGPTAAFIVVVYGVIQAHGFDGLLLATFMAGVILVLVGLLKWGSYIKYVPHPVIIGFTAGIAASIFLSQLKDALGLALKLPGEAIQKIRILYEHIPQANSSALLVCSGSIVLIVTLRKLRPTWPGFLIAIIVMSGLASLLALPIATIHSTFGQIPATLPTPALPEFSIAKMLVVLPSALVIAFLAGVESLLSAVVADGMAGRQHRSNIELVAQGVANMASACFGGICATGAIARTATNIRAGAQSPFAGMLHAVFILIIMLLAAPLAGYIPLATLAAVLLIVAWNISERHHIHSTLVHGAWADKIVLMTTFLLTFLYDLTLAISVGVGLSLLLGSPFLRKLQP